MRQEYKYTVYEVGPKNSTILTDTDGKLVDSYHLGIQSFNPDESRLDVVISDPNENVLETYIDSQDYVVRGVMQGSSKINQVEVDPTIFFEDRTFLQDQILVEYRAFNNLYGKGADLYIADISSDRSELRLRSVSISPRDIQYYTAKLQSSLNDQSYFSEAYLEIDGYGQVAIVNAIPEVIDSTIVATIKLYEPLPTAVDIKAVCRVLESLGESSRFSVKREIVVIEDPLPQLKGPNFAVEVGSSTIVSDYKNYLELLSQKSWEASKGLYTAFKHSALHTSVDYSDFSDFIHFSSAAERLENARFKFEYIFNLQAKQQKFVELNQLSEVKKISEEIEGVIENFDHYENYLYFEQSDYAWPKQKDEETGLYIRPYVLVSNPLEYERWYEEMYQKAEAYDLNNKDILTNTIPTLIREDLDHNEPYLLFIDMIGQHFDDLWIYARAITDRYKADNRPDFGISKELVKDALENFGIDLYESNQNLNGLFELCQPDGTYDPGLETCVTDFRTAGSTEQPMLAEAYTKEVYKRIYHNIPTLLKTRGTSRGLRVLLNCFGIPNDILTFRVQGGVDPDKRPFFGPEESIQISPIYGYEFDCKEEPNIAISGSRDKIRLVPSEQVTEYRLESGSGSFFTQSVLSRYTSTTASAHQLTDDSHKVEVGFDVNEVINRIFRENLDDFTVDTVIGDPRNKLEDYGDPWRYLRMQILESISDVDYKYRYPAAIIRLVRYFDTTFFRMLQDFIPARASIDSGVIVRDNILHRNRWRGVEASWQLLMHSGSITGSKVYGSHGGSFRYAGHKMDTGDKETVSTGDKWVLKDIPSGSREINGELTGSNLVVTNGELTEANDLRKARQPRNRYDINIWFLDLPDPPLCSSKLTPSIFTNYWIFDTNIASTFAAFPGSTEASILTPLTSSVFSTESNFYAAAQTHWTASELLPIRDDGMTFLGWFSVSGSQSIGNPETPYHLVDLSRYVEGDNYWWRALYTDAPRNVLWFTIGRPSGSSEYYYYYYPTDLMVSWKYLSGDQDPVETHMTGSVSVWGMIGYPTIVVDTEEPNYSYEIKMPLREIFGTEEGYFWVGFENFQSASAVQFVGVKEINGYTGPFFDNGKVVDAQWHQARGDWPYREWELITGSVGPREGEWDDDWDN